MLQSNVNVLVFPLKSSTYYAHPRPIFKDVHFNLRTPPALTCTPHLVSANLCHTVLFWRHFPAKLENLASLTLKLLALLNPDWWGGRVAYLHGWWSEVSLNYMWYLYLYLFFCFYKKKRFWLGRGVGSSEMNVSYT